MKKIIIILLMLFAVFSLTACGNKEVVEDNKNTQEESTNTIPEETKQEENTNNEEVVNDEYYDDEIAEFDDVDNAPPEEEVVVVEKVINCDGCVYSYFSETKKIGSALSESEYTTDINNLKTAGGKQRHNFFGFVLNGNTISKAYSCIYKDNKIYCIQGSSDGAYFTSNIGVLNQIFTADQCKYISNGHTYTCTDGNYNGDTITTGYTALHYETSCTIYGSEARTGELICH